VGLLDRSGERDEAAPYELVGDAFARRQREVVELPRRSMTVSRRGAESAARVGILVVEVKSVRAWGVIAELWRSR
jgi:hypothetical protein